MNATLHLKFKCKAALQKTGETIKNKIGKIITILQSRALTTKQRGQSIMIMKLNSIK